MTTNHPTSISLSTETKRRLKEFSVKRGWPISRLVQYIINEWLDFQNKRAVK